MGIVLKRMMSNYIENVIAIGQKGNMKLECVTRKYTWSIHNPSQQSSQAA